MPAEITEDQPSTEQAARARLAGEFSQEARLSHSDLLRKRPTWLAGNVANPFLNALAVESYNTASNVLSFVTRHDLIGKKEHLEVAQAEFLTDAWLAQNVATGLGMVIPYALAGKAAGTLLRTSASKLALSGTAEKLVKSQITAMAAGAAALDFSRDTRPGETRLGNAAGGAVAFAIFAKGNAMITSESFWARQAARAGVGSTGALAQLVTSRGVSGEGLPSAQQALETAITGGALNIALPATQKAITDTIVGAKAAVPEIRDNYYRAKWALQDGYVEAKRQTYAFLNQHDLRHPIQRLSRLFWPSESPERALRAPLTPENNPVAGLEKALPEYFRKIQELETKLEAASDRAGQAEIYEQMKEVRVEFAHQLHIFWHGTPERPGMVAYSDVELATPATGARRVAQIRDALTQTAGRSYPDPSPLTKALAQLAGIELERGRGYRDNYQLDEVLIAKGRFFGYDERQISSRMSPPAWHHAVLRAYGTPVSWMPFKATELLPNFFHGSTSESLRPILTETMMLSAKEMRLRGIEQRTGECALEEFPRRAISITRDFGEAWVYHRHSPDRITGFPIIFGITKDVAPLARSAGLLEPGEVLIDRLHAGNSLSSRLGLRAADITHLYVPDGQIPLVTRTLADYGAGAIRVIGLSQVPQPEWVPQVLPPELTH